ncbi:MAG: aminotransferase class V-fold PLP-dependent enzyme [Ardenticatenales bacterium]
MDRDPILADPPSAGANDPLLAWRDRFPILAHSNYLISNSLGAVPSGAYDAVHEYIDVWASRGVQAWQEAWWTMSADLGARVAPLLGAAAGDVVFQPCVTIAHAIVLSALDFATRPRIVTDAMHFPSILYLLDGLRAQGAEIITIPTDDGITVDAQRVADAIDDSTAAVCLSHVLFRSAYIHDLAPITAKARRHGALSVIDGYQAVGIVPVDVAALDIDVYIGGVLKWLCGGPGGAFLWVEPSRQRTLRPGLTGWMADAHPFEFAPTLTPRDDIWRFLTGTPNIPALYAARPGLEILNAVGAAAIRAKSKRQTARLLALADAADLPCTTPRDPARRGGTVAVDVPDGYAISQALKARGVICDYRPLAGIRLSPHFYTRDDELDAAVEAIVEIRASGEWRPYAAHKDTVT